MTPPAGHPAGPRSLFLVGIDVDSMGGSQRSCTPSPRASPNGGTTSS
ncbi:hypothetical protein [Streptomyces cinnamoneus]|nr:hypothetical protein [Streptomyces cinnamoneus]